MVTGQHAWKREQDWEARTGELAIEHSYLELELSTDSGSIIR